MKRFHVHLRVKDLMVNIQFYTQFFGMSPSVEKPDYAKWMLEDPKINFAISTHGDTQGINHLGIELDSEEALFDLQSQRQSIDSNRLATQVDANCCYAKSQKFWLKDPQSLPWEVFYSSDKIDDYGYSDTEKSITSAMNEGLKCNRNEDAKSLKYGN